MHQLCCILANVRVRDSRESVITFVVLSQLLYFQSVIVVCLLRATIQCPLRITIANLSVFAIDRWCNHRYNGRTIQYTIEDIVNLLNGIGSNPNIPEQIRAPWGMQYVASNQLKWITANWNNELHRRLCDIPANTIYNGGSPWNW